MRYLKLFESFEYHIINTDGTIDVNNNNIYLRCKKLFEDTTKIELLNDFDMFRDEDTDIPAIFIDRLNDFLLTIGKPTVEKVNRYKNI